MNKKAVVLLSGGLDSATTLAIAKSQGFECHALSFNYGQRHGIELDAAKQLARALSVKEHRILEIDLTAIGGSALTEPGLEIPETPEEGIPVTYVPARNTIFLSFALACAEAAGAHDIFIGVNAVDYSGYPDCRPEYIEAFSAMANLATRDGIEGRPFRFHTPLIKLSKAEIIRKGHELGLDYSLTISCYQPDAEGLSCGVCDSCRFRRYGFEQAGIKDPARYRKQASA